MKIAVLTLTRDRLAYTKHCLQRLRDHAGCDYDHFILDQASKDGTQAWLYDHYRPHVLVAGSENIGISRGINLLLDLADGYDVIIKIDNDCELTQPDTIRDIADLVACTGWLLSPRILGLNRPPPVRAEHDIDGERLLELAQIGGIFLAAPARIYDRFRYSETNPVWGGDDGEICAWWREQGGRCGYVERLQAWHYETTSGQHARYPGYFARTRSEGKAVL